MRTVGAMHAAGVAHCRLTTESVVVRNDGGDGDEEGGDDDAWDIQCVSVRDFDLA